MAHVRLTASVDENLVRAARDAHPGATDSSLMEAALRALVGQDEGTATDTAYANAYAHQPLSEPDEWGDLGSWRANAGSA